jgi:hypothetical protein
MAFRHIGNSVFPLSVAYELHVPRIVELRSDLGIVVAMQLISLQQHGDTDRLIVKRANVGGDKRQCCMRI